MLKYLKGDFITTTKTRKFTAYADPSHAWVKVPRKLINDLGIAYKISQSSFQRGNFCYLEEDADLNTFVKAMESKGIKPEFKVQQSNKSSRIRSYYCYEEKMPCPVVENSLSKK